MMREKMSRPSSSVPNQCAVLGGWRRKGKSILPGSCGAIHGANTAKTTKTATSTMHAVASTLRLPKVVAAIQVVEAIGFKLTTKGTKVTKGNQTLPVIPGWIRTRVRDRQRYSASATPFRRSRYRDAIRA